MGEVFINKYPLAQYKITRLRDKTAGTNEFRNLVEEIGMSMGYEAFADLATENIEVETPLERTLSPVIVGRKMTAVPILRTGLGMMNDIQVLVLITKVGHTGPYHDPDIHEPVEYYCKFPTPIEERIIVVADPMLATGGSACGAIRMIKQHGGKKIKFMCIIAAPEGLERLRKEHPDTQIYVDHLDHQLNEHAYILPGLDDMGDRIFGTK